MPQIDKSKFVKGAMLAKLKSVASDEIIPPGKVVEILCVCECEIKINCGGKAHCIRKNFIVDHPEHYKLATAQEYEEEINEIQSKLVQGTKLKIHNVGPYFEKGSDIVITGSSDDKLEFKHEDITGIWRHKYEMVARAIYVGLAEIIRVGNPNAHTPAKRRNMLDRIWG